MKSKVEEVIESLKACKKEVDLFNAEMLDPLGNIHIPTTIVVLVTCIILIALLSTAR